MKRKEASSEGRSNWLSRNVVLLSLSSLFGDVSTEMLYPILPLFLTQTLGAGGSIVGLIDGIAQATQNVVQGASGSLSDRLGRRKPLALAGFLLAALSKPLMGAASAWTGVLGARFLDRVGAGTRSAPRDALIAASVPDKDRGRAFGLEGLGDNLGACIGPLLAVYLLGVLADMRAIFYLAVIPGLLAFAMVLLVRESPKTSTVKPKASLQLARFPRGYVQYLIAVAVIGAGSPSNAFLILRTQEAGVSIADTVLIYAGFNLVAALASYPAGLMSDRFGRRAVLLAALAIFLGVYAGFATSNSVAVIALLFVAYGVYQGIFRAVGKAFAADFVPSDMRAGGIGWYTAVTGLTQLVASIVAGLLWDRVGHAAPFVYGAGVSLIGIVVLAVLVPARPSSVY